MGAMLKECIAFDEARHKAGQWQSGIALQSIQTAKTLRSKGGNVVVLDGPFAETKEWLGGVVVLALKDKKHAVDLLSNHPALRYGVAIEIRPIDEEITALGSPTGSIQASGSQRGRSDHRVSRVTYKVRPLRGPEGCPRRSRSQFSGPAFWPARIKSMGTFEDKTPGDPTDPIERSAAATVGRWRRSSTSIATGSGAWWSCAWTLAFEARLDASDVVQEAFLDVAGDLDAYLADPKLPPLLWLRLHVGRRLTTLHRQHLGTRMRDAGREISIYHGALPEASSAALASMLLGRHTSPTQAAQRASGCCASRRRSTASTRSTARC